MLCRLDKIICNSKQRWNKDKCRCECKELIDKGTCDKGYFFNPSNYECDKSCGIGEYLDYSNCKCRKRLLDPLIEKCTEDKDRCNSCIVYKALFLIFCILFIISIVISTYFVTSSTGIINMIYLIK